MGKILQIRVSAWTYREEDVAKTWPNLTLLVWPERVISEEKRGVLELVTALENGLSFGDWPDSVRKPLQEGIASAVRLKDRLESALSDWQPKEANKFSDSLEDALSDLNECAPEVQVSPRSYNAK